LFSVCNKHTDHSSDLQDRTNSGSVRGNPQNPLVHRLNLLQCLLSLQFEENFTGPHEFSIALLPAGKRAFLHGPAESRNGNLNRHGNSKVPKGAE
jgi:hypothetical protein